MADLLGDDNILVSIEAPDGVASTGNSSRALHQRRRPVRGIFSSAGDLAPGDTNHERNVLVRDLREGTTTLVSVNTNGTGAGNGDSFSPAISSDGRFVLFQSSAQNLAPNSLSYGSRTTINLFLRDLGSNVTYALTPQSLGQSGFPNIQPGVISGAMTPDGHYVTFTGQALLVSYSGPAAFVWDSYQAMLIYTNTSISGQIFISPNGQRLAYTNLSGLSIADLVAPTNNATVASASLASQPGLNFNSDGQFLVYATAAPGPGFNTNGQVYLYDVLEKTNLLVSHTAAGSSGNSASDSPAISPDGRLCGLSQLCQQPRARRQQRRARYFPLRPEQRRDDAAVGELVRQRPGRQPLLQPVLQCRRPDARVSKARPTIW